jgi:hypothetical protein
MVAISEVVLLIIAGGLFGLLLWAAGCAWIEHSNREASEELDRQVVRRLGC